MDSRHVTPEPGCQVVRTLDVVGEKWALLIVRDALRGVTRFSDFQASLGAPRDVLAARLRSLVEAGILEQRPYRDVGARERTGYHLTEAGLGLRVVIAAILQWNDRWDAAPTGPGSVAVDRNDEVPVELRFTAPDGSAVDDSEVTFVPGRGGSWAYPVAHDFAAVDTRADAPSASNSRRAPRSTTVAN
jgi:DNA-binding HxlR family transcriptional regulator